MAFELEYIGVYPTSDAKRYFERQLAYEENGVSYWHCWARRNFIDNPLPDDGKLRKQVVIDLNRQYRNPNADFELHDPLFDHP
jgi:hypothetical protein